jgi:hypothetical protein
LEKDRRMEKQAYDSSKRTSLKYFLAGSAVVVLETTGRGNLLPFRSLHLKIRIIMSVLDLSGS